MQSALCDLVRRGWSIEAASGAVGITHQTVFNWLRWAKDPTKADHYREFEQRLRLAQAESEGMLTENIVNASYDPARWQAAAWMLKARFPERYSDRHAIELRFSSMSDAKLREYVSRRIREVGKVPALGTGGDVDPPGDEGEEDLFPDDLD